MSGGTAVWVLPSGHLMRLAVMCLVAIPALLGAQGATVNWPVYGGTADNTRYSTLSQISPANVRRLRVAWTYQTHDEFPGSEMQSNPVVVDGVLYTTTPKLRVVALDAATGKELWSVNPNLTKGKTGTFRNRGVTVHGDRVFFTYRNWLWAVDRKTGQRIPTFGDSGRVDLRVGLDRALTGVSVSATTPGVVFEDLYIIGSTVSETLPSSPGDIRAYDVKTGALRWTFHTIPHPGEFGYETWSPDAYKISGGTNAWSGLTVDHALGMVFGATGSASFDFYGANRLGDNLFANTVLALDARSGKRIWHFQGVKHDLWDLDFPAPPSLVTVMRGGHKVDALAQITKTGHVYVFDRRTGAPLFPIEDHAVPTSTLEGESTSATQPLPTMPSAFARQRLTADMLTTRTPAAHKAALEIFHQYESGGLFAPPSTKGTIVFPGFHGGAEWGGGAFDPESGLLYVNSNEMAWLLRMVPRQTWRRRMVPRMPWLRRVVRGTPWLQSMLPRNDEGLYQSNCASCHGSDLKGTPGTYPSLVDVGSRMTREELATIIRNGSARMPAFGELFDGGTIEDVVTYLVTGEDVSEPTPSSPNYLSFRNEASKPFQDPSGYPAIKPPWGTLNAIDLNNGVIRWTIPFGEYPALVAQGMRNTGTDNYGGPVVTANGLLFIGATTYDNKFHAYDKRTGELLWEALLPAAGNATPSLYVVNGREYVVIACGGGKNGTKSGGAIVAFALPR